MRVLSQDRGTGTIKVRVDTLDDLWHLSHLVRPGDLVFGKTQRRLDERQDMVRDTATERVTVTLGVRVEQVEFHEASQRLRVLGTIERAPETINAGVHHTIAVGEHDWVEVIKPDGWPQHLLERVQDAVEATNEPQVTVVAMDDDEGTVAVLHQFGVREIGTKRRAGGGKQYKGSDQRDAFYAELREVLATTAPEGCPVIVVGPGFARENFHEHLKENPVDRVGAIVTEPASQPGMPGVQEALKRGVVKRVAQASRLSEEVEAVEELMARIGTTGLATYGPREVEHALNMGAVERLLVLDTVLRGTDAADGRDGGGDGTGLDGGEGNGGKGGNDRDGGAKGTEGKGVQNEGDRLLELARRTGAETLVIGSGHEAGERLAALTGIAALLRYRIERPADR